MEDLKEVLIKKIQDTTNSAVDEINSANSRAELDNIRLRYIGYKGSVPDCMKQLRNIDKDHRPEVGDKINESVCQIRAAIEAKTV